MRIVEFASAEEQLALWKLVSDNVWGAISQQAKAEAEQKAQKRAQAKKAPKPKRKAMPPPATPSVPPPPIAPIPKPNPQTYVGRGVSKPATSVSAQPQQAIGVAKSIQPKRPANASILQGMQQGRGVEKSALPTRKIGFKAK